MKPAMEKTNLDVQIEELEPKTAPSDGGETVLPVSVTNTPALPFFGF